jgi:ankyrin repeat protein
VSIYGLCGDSLKFLLEANPAAAAVEDTAGRMPLHVAVDKHRPWLRLIETLIAAYPAACSTRDGPLPPSLSHPRLLLITPPVLSSGGGRLPLHIVVDRNNPCIETLKLVIQAHPEGASTRRGVGRLPIHYAVFYDQPTLEVVKYLLEVYPAGAQTTDVYGRLPLHYAVDRSRPHLAVVQYLLSIYPNAAFARDTNHRLPLMIAIDHLGPNESTAVVELLLEINPNSIKERGPGGRFPLHVAVEVPKPNLALVRYLAPLYPEALSAEITTGLLFLCLISRSLGSVSVSPSSLASGKGDTPIALCQVNKSQSILRELLLVQPQHDPVTLRELNWKARKIAIFLSVPLPSTLITTIERETRPTLQTSRNSRITISVDGSYEIQENSALDTLRLARKSLQRLSNHASSGNVVALSPGYFHGLSEWELEHRAYVDIQDLFVSLYLVNRDIWRYVILFL